MSPQLQSRVEPWVLPGELLVSGLHLKPEETDSDVSKGMQHQLGNLACRS